MNSDQCGTCGKVFLAGWKAREQDCDAAGHQRPKHKCEGCNCYFESASACHSHMVALNHFSEECSKCHETWPSEEQRREHEYDEHSYCGACDRTFINRNNLNMHLNSKIHLGSPITCNFCKRGFVTTTGLSHHVESGACRGAHRVGRDKLYEFIRSVDTEGVISKQPRDGTGPTKYEAKGPTKYEATASTFGASGYRCCLCPRAFTTFSGLNQHLNSPTHEQKIYHCPNCRQAFVILAALINHLESETCECMRFEDVERGFTPVVNSNRPTMS